METTDCVNDYDYEDEGGPDASVFFIYIIVAIVVFVLIILAIVGVIIGVISGCTCLTVTCL